MEHAVIDYVFYDNLSSPPLPHVNHTVLADHPPIKRHYIMQHVFAHKPECVSR